MKFVTPWLPSKHSLNCCQNVLRDEEFRKHFLSIASSEVDRRSSSLINELLEFARTSDPKLEMEDVNGILDGMILLVSTESKKKHIEIVKEYGQRFTSHQH